MYYSGTATAGTGIIKPYRLQVHLSVAGALLYNIIYIYTLYIICIYSVAGALLYYIYKMGSLLHECLYSSLLLTSYGCVCLCLLRTNAEKAKGGKKLWKWIHGANANACVQCDVCMELWNLGEELMRSLPPILTTLCAGTIRIAPWFHATNTYIHRYPFSFKSESKA